MLSQRTRACRRACGVRRLAAAFLAAALSAPPQSGSKLPHSKLATYPAETQDRIRNWRFIGSSDRFLAAYRGIGGVSSASDDRQSLVVRKRPAQPPCLRAARFGVPPSGGRANVWRTPRGVGVPTMLVLCSAASQTALPREAKGIEGADAASIGRAGDSRLKAELQTGRQTGRLIGRASLSRRSGCQRACRKAAACAQSPNLGICPGRVRRASPARVCVSPGSLLAGNLLYASAK